MKPGQAAKILLVDGLARLNPLGRVTELWNRRHAHLRPMADPLALPPEQIAGCPLCGARRAVRVLARLRFGPDHWIPEAEVHYCRSCGEYSLTPAERRVQVHASLAWARRHRPWRALLSYSRLTAVDARLWSATPAVLNLEPTTLCNFKCWYCIGRHMPQAELAFEDYERILDHIPGLQMIALVGEGEPLMHKRFFDMVRLAKERGLRVSTNSNGSAFSESVIHKICESGLDYISVSIDSIDPQRFAESRVAGDLEKVWAGIERLVRYRNERGLRYPILGLKGTLFRHTRGELPAILEEARRRGMDVVEFFQGLNPMRRYIDIYPADKQALVADFAAVNAGIETELAHGPLPGIGEFAVREQIRASKYGRPNRLRPNCDEEWIYSLLSGDVTPCCQLKTPMDPAWNLARHPLPEILRNERYENLRFNLWNGLFLKECDGCTKTLSPDATVCQPARAG